MLVLVYLTHLDSMIATSTVNFSAKEGISRFECLGLSTLGRRLRHTTVMDIVRMTPNPFAVPTDSICLHKSVAKIAIVCVKHVKRRAEEVMLQIKMTKSLSRAILARILIVIPIRKHLHLKRR